MKNEGFRNGMIELGVATVLMYLSIVLPKPVFAGILVVVIVGALTAGAVLQQKKRDFPVIFSKADQQLSSQLSDFYEQIKFENEDKRRSRAWLYWVIIPVFLVFIFMLYYWSRKIKGLEIFALLLLVMLGVFGLATFLTNFLFVRKIKRAMSNELQVARVEFYDASYDYHGKSGFTNYFIFVKKFGTSMKLRVSKQAYYYVLSRQSGEGYLIKLPKGNGVYDVFDFMPLKEMH